MATRLSIKPQRLTTVFASLVLSVFFFLSPIPLFADRVDAMFVAPPLPGTLTICELRVLTVVATGKNFCEHVFSGSSQSDSVEFGVKAGANFAEIHSDAGGSDAAKAIDDGAFTLSLARNLFLTELDFNKDGEYSYTPTSGLPGFGAAGATRNIYTIVSDKEVLGQSIGNSVTFNPAGSLLSFSGDMMSDTGFAGDPILGAVLSPPTFKLDHVSPDGNQVFFHSVGDGSFLVQNGTNTYLKAHIDSLVYDKTFNEFDGYLSYLSLAGVASTSPFFNPMLSTVSSPFLQSLDDVLNPASPLFEQSILSVVYRPNEDFFSASGGFTATAESPLTDLLFSTESPEPGSLFLVLSGVVAWYAVRRYGYPCIRQSTLR